MACDTDLRILSLNTRGLRSNAKRKVLFKFIKKQKYNVVCLQETHVTKEVVDQWSKEWGRGSIIYNESTANSCGQMILLCENIEKYNTLYNSRRILAVDVELLEKKLTIVNVYAPNNNTDKITFFEELGTVISNLDLASLVICGDFNTVLSNDLDVISGEKHASAVTDKFKQLLEEHDLYDVWRMFHPQEKEFTWSKKYPFIARRLDYVLMNDELFDKTIESYLISIPYSDHRGCVALIKIANIERGPGMWKFNNSLLKDIEYVTGINSLIGKHTSGIEEDSDSQMEWELLKVKIKDFSQNYSRLKSTNNKNMLMKLYQQLGKVDSALSSNPHSIVLQNEKQQIAVKIEIMERQKIHAAQVRARVKWVEEGEKNSKYFLGLEKSKSNSKIMTGVLDKDNQLITKQSEILNVQKSFFAELYTRKVTDENMSEKVNKFLNNTDVPQLSESQRNGCEGNLTESELLSALKCLKNDASPGSDGLTVEFLKVFWIHLKDILRLSLNSSFTKGELSTTQRKAVITLIHKGKELPRNDLKNWRPISLTNSDYKLLAKTLANRLSDVIHSIVSPDQVGFIKGRRASTLLRLIDDVIEQLNQDKSPGLLVSIDYTQAFDRISKDFMIAAFEKFGFGPDFIQWVKVIMANTQSCMIYCGWASDFFPVESGIRQGCPFSPLAFALAIEILAIKIRELGDIKGIVLGTNDDTILNRVLKIALYADDITLFMHDEHDMQIAITLFKEFSTFSGLLINKSKSGAMWLGNRKNSNEAFFGFQWKKKLKILGVYFANDQSASFIKENWEQRIENMKRIIHSWEKKDLSLIGKIHIIKTFLISQLIYFMQAFIIPEHVLTEINQILFRFLWRKKNCNRKAYEKVKRTVVCKNFENGGLKMIDIKQMQSAFLLQWAVSLCTSKESENWIHIPKKLFSKFGKNMVCFYANVKSKEFKGLDNITSYFWKRVLSTWLDGNMQTDDSLSSNLLWNNQLIKYQGKVIFFPDWIKGGILKTSDLQGPDGLLTLNEVINRIGRSPARLLEYNVVTNAVTHFFRRVTVQNILEVDVTQAPLFNGKKCFTCKQFRIVLSSLSSSIPCAVQFWNHKFGLDVNETVWNTPRLCTSETRLRVLQWKILHNIYPTNIMLNKMKLRNDQKCSYCNDETDYIEHFFFLCPVVKPLWNSVEQYVYINYNVKINISESIVLIGKQECGNTDTQTLAKINHLILIGKMCISIYKKTQSNLPITMILENQLNIRKF